MKYFAQHFPMESHAYNYSGTNRNDIAVKLESSSTAIDRMSRQTSTKESDDAYIQRVEDSIARQATKPGIKRDCLEQAILESLKKLAKKTSQRFRRDPTRAKLTTKLKQSALAYGEYSQPYIFY
jgi:hypothetical protein